MSSEVPQHIAIIMDGNGRWAKRRNRPRLFGHIRGSTRVKSVVQEASRLGVKALTFYAFSTENWSRPEGERSVLWKLLKKYLLRDLDELNRENVRLRVIGEISRLDLDVQVVLERALICLEGNTGLQLTFALSYGGRQELTQAAKRFAKDCVDGKLEFSQLTEKLMEQYLWTADLGDLSNIDLFIRTSGEHRISNFLLWQSAYAEFVFLDVCWPDFQVNDFLFAIEEYTKRERRFGTIRAE